MHFSNLIFILKTVLRTWATTAFLGAVALEGAAMLPFGTHRTQWPVRSNSFVPGEFGQVMDVVVVVALLPLSA